MKRTHFKTFLHAISVKIAEIKERSPKDWPMPIRGDRDADMGDFDGNPEGSNQNEQTLCRFALNVPEWVRHRPRSSPLRILIAVPGKEVLI